SGVWGREGEEGAEDRRWGAPGQQCQGVSERDAGCQESRQLLMERGERARVDALPLRQMQRQAADGAPPLERKDVESLVLELGTQPRFAFGHVHALDDFSIWRRQAAAKLHRSNCIKIA